MSHVTQEQAKKLKELGYPQDKAVKTFLRMGLYVDYEEIGKEPDPYAPSAEELMEWLKDRINFLCEHYADKWHVGDHLSDADLVKDFHGERLVDCLVECAIWVLEGKK